MASRRTRQQQQQPAAEDRESSYSESEEDEAQIEMQSRRPGRPRGLSTSSAEVQSALDDETAVLIQPVRRGRGPSKNHANNRNAVMARFNRERKKKYLESIEKSNKTLDEENRKLKSQLKASDKKLKQLNNEVTYLKNVMKNNTMITVLLKALNENLSARVAEKNLAVSTTTTNLNKSTDVQNWVARQTTSQSKANTDASESSLMEPSSLSSRSSEVFNNDKKRSSGEENTNPTKIARKSMPLNKNINIKSENPSSVESSLEEEDKMSHLPKFSPESARYCEYNRDQSSSRHDSQVPTTPMSQNISESLDRTTAKDILEWQLGLYI